MWACKNCDREYDLTEEQWSLLETGDKLIRIKCKCDDSYGMDVIVGLEKMFDPEYSDKPFWETYSYQYEEKYSSSIIMTINTPRHPYLQDTVSKEDYTKTIIFGCSNCKRGAILNPGMVNNLLPKQQISALLKCNCSENNPTVLARISNKKFIAPKHTGILFTIETPGTHHINLIQGMKSFFTPKFQILTEKELKRFGNFI